MFHTFVAKALFATKRSRPDINTAVAFLIISVWGPNKDDWKKLLRLMQYLRNTTNMPLTLRADGTNIVKWVGRWIIRCAYRHAQSNIRNNVAGKRSNNQHLHKTEDEHEELDRDRINCS